MLCNTNTPVIALWFNTHSVLYFPPDNVAPNSPCYSAIHRLLHLM